jgi:hypothetical protein
MSIVYTAPANAAIHHTLIIRIISPANAAASLPNVLAAPAAATAVFCIHAGMAGVIAGAGL